MAIATVIGAFGAHAFKSTWAADRFEMLHTAVLYQFLHALGLLSVGIASTLRPVRSLRVAGGLLFAGVMLFSGSLYLLLAGAPRVVGVLTPVGGACLIMGWSVAAVALWRETGGSEP